MPRQLASAFARFGPSFRKWMTAGLTATTFPRLQLMRVLHARGPQIMSVLGEQLDVTPRNVTVLVDGLEAEGLARRRPHPDDRRATIVELTPAGRRLVGKHSEVHLERVSALFACLDATEQEDLLRLINKLADELAAQGVGGGCVGDTVER
jgi:DNA-binding MarR family transcriptional regulator